GNGRGILYCDRVAQYIARIDNARRTQIREQNGVLLRVQHRKTANLVLRRIIGGRRARVIGGLVDDAVAVHEALVRDDRAVGGFRVHTATGRVVLARWAGVLAAAAALAPGGGWAGVLPPGPSPGPDPPATSATAAPFSVVLPAT